MKRTIHIAPQYAITKSGKVWLHRNRVAEAVAPFAVEGKFGLRHLAVKLDGQRHFVWQLLSMVWLENAMPLTRDGGMMNWDEDNYFTLKLNPSSVWCNGVLIPSIQFIWWLYQHERVPCVSISEKSGLSHPVDEYRELIKQILLSSVR